jgi:hypothetical protein
VTNGLRHHEIYAAKASMRVGIGRNAPFGRHERGRLRRGEAPAGEGQHGPGQFRVPAVQPVLRGDLIEMAQNGQGERRFSGRQGQFRLR